MNLGERIKSLRLSRSLTLEEVGEYVGVNKATAHRYESGDIDIKRTVAIKLSEILQTTPSYIMGWSDEIENSNNQNKIYALSDLEKRIIDDYRELNDEGQEKVIEYVKDLGGLLKYKKDNSSRRLASGA